MTLTLEECYAAISWIWWKLADNPRLLKLNIPETTKYKARCPACEYTWKISDDIPTNCMNICAMKSLWPKGCWNLASPYYKWEHSKGYDRGFFAAVIAEEAELLLEKEVNGEGENLKIGTRVRLRLDLCRRLGEKKIHGTVIGLYSVDPKYIVKWNDADTHMKTFYAEELEHIPAKEGKR